MNKSSELITKGLIEMYRIEENDNENEISIHSPAFINIDKDDKYAVYGNSICVTIENSKVIVNLWIKNKNMHVTVL